MATKYVADCGTMPSDSNCDLKISGSNKEDVAEIAYQHAIGKHQHTADEPGLKDKILQSLATEAA